MTPRLFGIVPAAGGGSRFGAAGPKQYASLAGRPMLARTIERLLAGLAFERLCVVVAPGDTQHRTPLAPFAGRVQALACGGATRADSVRNGIGMLGSDADERDWVLVHDAARPCVPVDALQRLMATVRDDATGGLLAIRVADTLKRAGAAPEGEAPRVLQTEAREGLWQAQTPQVFRLGVLRAALALAGAVTDEAQAVETLATFGALCDAAARARQHAEREGHLCCRPCPRGGDPAGPGPWRMMTGSEFERSGA